ncbi:MAG: ATP-dependent Clp protease ATP-binding subunit [Candidatus Paceibacterota bacterium]
MYYFKEPKLNLTAIEESLFNLISYSFYSVLIITTGMMIISDVPNLKWLGLLFLLFIADRIINLNKGERTILEIIKKIERKKEANIAHCLSPNAYKILSKSMRKSYALDKNFQIILLERLIKERDIKEALKRLDVDYNSLLSKIEEHYLEGSNKNKGATMSDISNIVNIAFETALNIGENFIEPRDLMVSLVKSPENETKKIFEIFNITQSDIEDAVIFGKYKKSFNGIKNMPSVLGGFGHSVITPKNRVMNRAWTARPTPYLDNFSIDLTNLARKEVLGFLIGHKKEFKNLLNIISRPLKPNALLVGEPGAGKSTIISHLAFRIIRDDVPKELFDKRLVSLEINKIISDAEPEEMSSRLEKIGDEIMLADNIIIFIPNIHDLFKSIKGDSKSMNVIDMLIPILKKSSVPIIGETYPKELKQYIEKRSDFMEMFQSVDVKEITKDEAVRVLTYQSLIFENQFKLFITLRAIKKSVFLAYRYLHKKPLPSSAVELLKQSLAKAQNNNLKTLDENTVIEVAQELSNIPIQRAEGEELDRLLNLENIIHQRLINQELAVKSVSRSLREYRSGLSEEGGPIATFLFTGPTGVGKTELAKILTKVQFGDKNSMIRFDMSEYQDKTSIFRFIGTPDGEKTGSLTDAVLEKPYSLILLDEFEKAHPDILNLFLQVFDDGRLTDSLGRTVSFENTIIIVTSNAHSTLIKESIEKNIEMKEIAETIKSKLTDYFKPELINRFSDIVVFRSLNIEEIEKVTVILIKEVVNQLKASHGIDLVIDSSAIKEIAKLGYSPTFGARPLKKVISEKIKSNLANKILKKQVDRGNVVKVLHEENKFKFKIIK